ncbi:MAG TPA: PAS domain-containing sensor histidine kinase [Desulfobacterales bacterium]|nr:PAS domain-containing sensor histidine kinase [Desulfobacterales bacterium]
MDAAPTYEDLLERNKKLEQESARRIEAMVDMDSRLELYSSLVDNASDLIHSVSPDGSFLYVNQAWRDALGYSQDDLSHIKLMDIVDEGCRSKCRQVFNCLMQGQTIDRNETVFVTKEGKKIVVEGRCHTKFEDDRPVLMAGIFRDVGKRVEQEQALRESEEKYRTLFENSTDLIQAIRPDGRLLYVNRAWMNTFGYNEEDIATGLSIFDLIAPDCLQHCQKTFQQVISTADVHYIDTCLVAKDGSRIIIEGNACCKFQEGKPVTTQCIFRDVTEKKKMEEGLLRAQKLESIGVFAGGIAHDFNNLLTAILGNISLAKVNINPQDTVFGNLEKTEKAALQARSLTQQLLTFAKGGAPIKKITTITELIKDSTSFAMRGANVKCEYQLPEDLWPIEVDEGQLSQVSQNLVINACQAMPEGGTLIIRGINRVLSEHDQPLLPAGRYVCLYFQDQGIGISKENLLKIFDPYFTSKKTGSGLGLAIAYSIIKKHDGLITVDSEIGRGSTFSIYLPATEKKVSVQETTEKMTQARAGKVLVMDDDENIRKVATQMLQHLDCEVDTAEDGEEAIELYFKAKEEGKPFDVVIMDLTIPGGMGGKEAIGKMRALDPGIKAIASSGYATDPIMANFKEYGFSGVIPKPYKIGELSEVLAEVIKG